MTKTSFRMSKEKRNGNCSTVYFPHLKRFAAPASEPGWREEPTTICGDILHAAHAEVERIGAGPRTPTSHLEAMLGVISYCYTKGLFSSMSIERELWKTPAFLGAFGHRLPTAQQIRHFRRTNRPIILSVIEQAIVEFSRREPSSVQRQVIAMETHLANSSRAIAQWLLDMATCSDEDEE